MGKYKPQFVEEEFNKFIEVIDRGCGVIVT